MLKARKLTSFESAALGLEYNLADGHATFEWPDEYEFVRSRLERHFFDSLVARQGDEEIRFVESFTRLSKQSRPRHARLTPSASMSLEIAAHALRSTGRLKVGMIEPTFDNLADIFARVGLSLAPLAPEEIREGHFENASNVDALVIVWPNNPFGDGYSTHEFARLLRFAERSRVAIVFDFSFRLLSTPMATFDQYDMLTASGVQYICIEDTGKVLPANDLKVSMLSSSPELATAVETVAQDMYLATSRFSLRLNAELLDVSATVADLPASRLAMTNAEILEGSLCSLVVPPAWHISVRVLYLGKFGVDGSAIVRRAEKAGVGVLPLAPFFWSEVERGANLVRIALARDRNLFACGVEVLRQIIGV